MFDNRQTKAKIIEGAEALYRRNLELYMEIQRLRAKLDKAHEAISYADGCFGAALFEGWDEALATGDLEQIRDLWQRRLSFARDHFVGTFDREDAAADEEAKGNLVFRDDAGKPTAILDLSGLK